MAVLVGQKAFLAISWLVLLLAMPKISVAQSLESAEIDEAIETAIARLLEIQKEDGSWPYEGVYRVNRKIPVGYRIGGTAICCEALLYGTKIDNEKANDAIRSGVKRIIAELKDPRMKPIKPNRYDVRIWGHIYALDLFCRIKQQQRLPDLDATLGKQIQQLTEAILFQQIPESGGWNYANGRAQASFVTAPAAQALMWADQNGQVITLKTWDRIAQVLKASRDENSAYTYSGPQREKRTTPIQSSIARSANCEATLSLLSVDSELKIKHSIDKFHEHWDELEKRRKKNGTHKPPFGIAPYYFYYAHRYVAFAINCLPEAEQAKERKRLREVVMRTRDENGTWNDRVFPRSRAYGTAMAVLTLLGEKVPSPDRIKKWNADIPFPDLEFIYLADKRVTLDQQKIDLAEFSEWLGNKKFAAEPEMILIHAIGEARVGDVEIIKRAISKRFPESRLYTRVFD